MALFKPVVQEDGVTTNYHRIVYVQITTNRQNSIAVKSYTSPEARSGEKTGTIAEPYSKNITYETDYNPEMTTGEAYAYVKSLPEFEGAENI